MTEATKKLATFAAELDYEAIPADVVARAKLLVLDLTGIALRARFDADSMPAMMQAMKALGLDSGTGSVIGDRPRSEEHTSELQSLMRTSYAVFCLKKN